MFKQENQIWWYLLGIIIMFGILITLGRELIIPFLYGGQFKIIDPSDFRNPPGIIIDSNADYLANIQTNYGTITVDLYEDSAPLNVNNFVYLSQNSYYNRTRFHRLIPDFLIQGGDRNTLDINTSNDGCGAVGYYTPDEINWDSLDLPEDKRNELANAGFRSTPNLESQPFERFSLVMANQNKPDSNGSQFFIVIAKPNDQRLYELEGYFTVIGTVVGGGSILEQFSEMETESRPSCEGNVQAPSQEIVLERIDIYTR